MRKTDLLIKTTIQWERHVSIVEAYIFKNNILLSIFNTFLASPNVIK